MEWLRYSLINTVELHINEAYRVAEGRPHVMKLQTNEAYGVQLIGTIEGH